MLFIPRARAAFEKSPDGGFFSVEFGVLRADLKMRRGRIFYF